MTVDSKGRELFIVDNSVSGWTGLRYLEEWSGIANAFDIATGYFEIGALLTLDGKWQGLDKIRILMGAETTHRTRKAILEAVRAQALDRLDESIEEDKEPNPFLHGVPAILDALRSGQIECRVYDRHKFHAKAYITHAKLEVVGAQALLGSSNFTRPGLTKNVELNVQIQRPRTVEPAPEHRYVTSVPLVPLKAAAGAFSDPQQIEDDDFDWIAVESRHRLHRGMFVAQVVGKSMEPGIRDGAWCLFRGPVDGTRQGKIVLVQLRDATDPETGQRYTVKRYKSQRAKEGNSWRHEKITLEPVNADFERIVLTGADEDEVQVIAELVEVLGG